MNPTASRYGLDTAAFIEDLEWLLDTGEGVMAIPGRLGVSSVESVTKRLRTAGRLDLVARITTRYALEVPPGVSGRRSTAA